MSNPNNTNPTGNTYDYDNPDYIYQDIFPDKPVNNSDQIPVEIIPLKNQFKYVFIVSYSVILLLGVALNGLVICMVSCKMKKTPSAIWFLCLAVTDFLFCLFLPFTIVYALYDFDWFFGLFLCKVNSYIMFFNMFSSAAFLAIIRINHGIYTGFACAQNFCTANVARNVALLTWFVSAILSIPSLVIRNTSVEDGKTICFDKYDIFNDTSAQRMNHQVVLSSRILCSIAIPYLIICTVSFFKRSRSKAYKITRFIIVAYFICWVPYHVLMTLALYPEQFNKEVFVIGMPIVNVLAAANSCMNPVIYICMSRDCKMSWMENAFSRKSFKTSPQLRRINPEREIVSETIALEIAESQ
ncbi:chemokine-like receptor 1 [Polyodon spathula]|uniref:chemokine-like receptor 1 n=1 Tax=Polyodon spathula TaxID=7913 RepID=UPI001B7F0805|nr:chemokine-like receptor 1 [Polyodon spathula]